MSVSGVRCWVSTPDTWHPTPDTLPKFRLIPITLESWVPHTSSTSFAIKGNVLALWILGGLSMGLPCDCLALIWAGVVINVAWTWFMLLHDTPADQLQFFLPSFNVSAYLRLPHCILRINSIVNETNISQSNWVCWLGSDIFKLSVLNCQYKQAS